MRRYSPVLVTPPAELPVSVDEARAYCRIDTNDEDDLVTALIESVVSHLDGWYGVLRRAIVTQTWAERFDYFCPGMRLSLPASAVTEVGYVDAAGVGRTVDLSLISLRDEGGSTVRLIGGGSWSGTQSDSGAILITYTAGYGAAADVPAGLKRLVLMMVSHWYENREAVMVGPQAAPLPLQASMLLDQYKVRSF